MAGKGSSDGWWRDWEDPWGKAKGRGRRKGDSKDKDKDKEKEKKAPEAKEKEKDGPRAKDEVFEEIRNVLSANPALQIQFFDARVRQHLHALLGSGGRQRLKAALTKIHTCTMHKTRQDVKNWPAYLLTLLKKFDTDVANQEPMSERRKEAKFHEAQLSNASTTPEKDRDASSGSDFDARGLELTGLNFDSDDDDDEPPAPAGMWDLPAPRVTAPPPKPRPELNDFHVPQVHEPLGTLQAYPREPYPREACPERERGVGSTFGTFGTSPDGRPFGNRVRGGSTFPVVAR